MLGTDCGSGTEAGGCGLLGSDSFEIDWPGGAKGAVSTAAAAVRIRTMLVPVLTLSPTLTSISCTSPARSAGTSIAALSDSSVISVSSTVSTSPTAT